LAGLGLEVLEAVHHAAEIVTELTFQRSDLLLKAIELLLLLLSGFKSSLDTAVVDKIVALVLLVVVIRVRVSHLVFAQV
jgi:hypothetical protein